MNERTPVSAYRLVSSPSIKQKLYVNSRRTPCIIEQVINTQKHNYDKIMVTIRDTITINLCVLNMLLGFGIGSKDCKKVLSRILSLR